MIADAEKEVCVRKVIYRIFHIPVLGEHTPCVVAEVTPQIVKGVAARRLIVRVVGVGVHHPDNARGRQHKPHRKHRQQENGNYFCKKAASEFFHLDLHSAA